MVKLKAQCIKETYDWEGEEHHFSHVKIGFIYMFNKDKDGIYWLDKSRLPNHKDFEDENGYIDGCSRGLHKEQFCEMFKIIEIV